MHLIVFSKMSTDEQCANLLVRLVQSMYKDLGSKIRVGDGYLEAFLCGIGCSSGLLGKMNILNVREGKELPAYELEEDKDSGI